MILSAAIPAKVGRPKHTTTTIPLTHHHSSKSLNAFHCYSYKLNASSSSLANGTSQDNNNKCHQNPNPSSDLFHHVNHAEEEGNCLIPSASAIAAAIRNASTASPVDFIQRIQKNENNHLVLPSSDFQRLCSEQLDLFREIIDTEIVLSVYVRPAGSYVMDRLELRRVTLYPVPVTVERADTLVLIGSFGVPTGLRVAEASLLNQQLEVIHEFKAIVFPMVKHPFVVGFLVAEFPLADFEACSNRRGAGQALQLCPPPETYPLPSHSDRNKWDLKTSEEDSLKTFHQFTAEQRSIVLHISRSLAMAYIMDQKAMLLQQSSWQNNIRMSELVEQIRGSLSSIRSLSKMLSTHTKRSEISFDIIEDILVQGDQMRDTLQKLQDAVFLTKANIVRYNEETLRRRKQPTHVHPESGSPQSFDKTSDGSLPDKTRHLHQAFPLSSAEKDLEMPMPPLALVPLQQHKIRPCNVSDVLADLVGAAGPLAHKLQRTMELSELSQSLQVAVEESALRQALSNLIEGALLRTHAGGKVKIVSTGAPAGGVLVIVDDDGPDMHYMTQMHSLTQFGPNLSSDGIIEDNMTWNFVSGLTVAREILESYGCVVRVISPRVQDPVFGAGGSRIELWFPSHTPTSDSACSTEEA